MYDPLSTNTKILLLNHFGFTVSLYQGGGSRANGSTFLWYGGAYSGSRHHEFAARRHQVLNRDELLRHPSADYHLTLVGIGYPSFDAAVDALWVRLFHQPDPPRPRPTNPAFRRALRKERDRRAPVTDSDLLA